MKYEKEDKQLTGSLSKFLEFMSTQDEATKEKVSKMERDDLIAYAAEAGFTLTPADLEEAEPEGELDLDDADAVAGGGACVCVVGGGGTACKDGDAPSCACVFYGQGKGPSGAPDGYDLRCVCPGAGGGCDCAQEGIQDCRNQGE